MKQEIKLIFWRESAPVRRRRFLLLGLAEVTQNLGGFLPDPVHVVDQELEVGINCSHFCVYGATGTMDLLRAPLLSALEVVGHIVHFNLIVLLPLPSLSPPAP